MSKIHSLSADLIAKIAAGEVIERPCYVVKELIENAIDAGATDIQIDIRESGFRQIRVIDNGEGMDRKDVLLSVQPHTTSKLRELQELVGITSLGFRGEALSSIAAVSDLTIQSKPLHAVVGTKLRIRGREQPDIQSIGMPAGTKVTVDHLFAHVPARRKFLKSPSTEWRRIFEVVTDIALGYPMIRFYVTHNDRVIIDLPAGQDVLKRIEQLLGISISQALLPVRYEDSYLHIQGFVSKPPLVTYDHHKHYLFANSRSIRDKMISLAIKEAFGDLLDPTAHPIAILALSTPANVVDVNIHPRKEQVVFLEQRFVFDVVQRAVALALSHYTVLPATNVLPDSLPSIAGNRASSYAATLLKDAVLPDNPLARTQLTKSAVLLQLHNTYIVVPTKTGFLLIDQHAAHERILYEQFAQQLRKKKAQAALFMLPTPVTFDVPYADGLVLQEHLDFFQQLGFRITRVSASTFLLSSVPDIFRDRDAVALVREIGESLAEERPVGQTDSQSRRLLNMLSCRSAVKAGDPLTPEECRQVVTQLQQTPNHLTCPHGRPTAIEVTVAQLQTWFKRT